MTTTLVVGDLHAPFIKSGYLKHCKKIYQKYNCNTVVFIGDILDNHYSSFHESDPDGHSAAQELKIAKKMITKWYEAFPDAYVCIGNHDAISNRKAMTAGLSATWIRSIEEVLDVPNWKFSDNVIINGVKYVHGIGRKAKARAQEDMINIVQGHYHTESYIHFLQGINKRIFSVQVGCGIDAKSYAMAYAKHFRTYHLNCGVVIDGKLPILEYM